MNLIAKLPRDPKSKAWAINVDYMASDSEMLELCISGRGSQYEVFLINSFNGLLVSIPSDNICCMIKGIESIDDNHRLLAARMNKVDAATIVYGISFCDVFFEDNNPLFIRKILHSTDNYMRSVSADCDYIYDVHSPLNSKLGNGRSG